MTHFQLKSEVTCKVCQYKSVRFDPFTFLSLPLPMESTVNLEVIGEGCAFIRVWCLPNRRLGMHHQSCDLDAFQRAQLAGWLVGCSQKKRDIWLFSRAPLKIDNLVAPFVVMFLDGRQPVKYGLRLEIDEKYRLLKEELGKLCDVPPARLLLVEMYASNIRVRW